jgi:NAD(P)-dependent dehydrogenase (short-subunit alcohol dehydrogenase family)
MSKWLEGKVAVVTGGASGIGRAVVHRFVQEGAKVCVLDRNGDRLRQVSIDIPGDNVVVVEGDVTVLEDSRRAVQAAVNTFGRLDVFVGNAGVFDGFVTLERLPEETIGPAFDEIFHVNVKGYLLGAKTALPELLKTSGNMVFTASAAGFYPNGGGALYTASKHAVVGLIRQLAYELAPSIRVNGVAPGGTITDLGTVPSIKRHAAVPLDVASKEALIRSRNPLRIAMRPEDHAAAYVFLASELGKAMTGEIIHSDGGLGVRGFSGAREPKS